MTNVALLRRHDMIGRLADRRGVVMATAAGAADLSMINRYRGHKTRCGVTGFATVATGDMGRRLRSCISRRIMTLRTIIDDACVAKRRRRPATGVMADIAFLGGGNMRRGFTGRDLAIVATAASPDHLVVIHRHGGHKRGGVMTGLANIRCLNMGGRLAH